MTVLEYEWHYVPRGKVTHARKRRSGGLDGTARCGTAPAWYEPIDWHGTGSQAEYERAAALPKCRRCLRLTGALA